MLILQGVVREKKNFILVFIRTKIYITEPKTKKSTRTIPLSQNIINDLLQWQQTQFLDLGKKDFCFLASKTFFLRLKLLCDISIIFSTLVVLLVLISTV